MPDIFAPAKVNLFLHVTGRHEGYHTLQSVCFFPSIGDRLSVMKQPEGTQEDSLQLSGPFAHFLPKEAHQNLLFKLLHYLRSRVNLPYYHIQLQKRLPVAAGIGGGSADAAALLRVISRDINVDFSDEPWRSEITTLGADIPACYLSSPLLAEGIGDEILPWGNMPEFGVLLVNPMLPLSTKEVFARNSVISTPAMIDQPKSRAGWLSLIKTSTNDLQDAAESMIPEITHILTAIRQTDQLIAARMSGSGATCFGLYNSLADAQIAESLLRKAHPEWWIEAGKVQHGAAA